MERPPNAMYSSIDRGNNRNGENGRRVFICCHFPGVEHGSSRQLPDRLDSGVTHTHVAYLE